MREGSEERPGRGDQAEPSPEGFIEMACQLSVYPLRRARIGDVIEAAVAAAARRDVRVRVQNLSTVVSGSEDEVFAAVREAFRAMREEGAGVMVGTFSTGLPADEEVAEIQARAAGD